MIKYLITDCDGVLTDGKYYYFGDGNRAITFHANDSVAVTVSKLDSKIDIILVSSTSLPELVSSRAESWKVPFIHIKPFNKLEVISSRYDLTEVAYIGDSLDDIPMLKEAELSFTPSSSLSIVKQHADVVLERASGCGCLLEAYLELVKWVR
jgi:YrbI family 3-deoxy-D-manno-octulosonate 8-phosphate phosphatase